MDYKAVVDLGTNTFQLLIGSFKNGKLLVEFERKFLVQLGAKGINNSIISNAAIERGKIALEKIQKELAHYQVEKPIYLATSAMRNASNAEQVMHIFEPIIGHSIQILSGKQEASLIAKAVLNQNYPYKNYLIVDIGGGSVECILVQKGAIKFQSSIEIGAHRLLDKYQVTGVFSKQKSIEIKEHLRPFFQSTIEKARTNQVDTLIGTAGSFDTFHDLAAFKTQSNHSLIGNAMLKEIFRDILSVSLEQRSQIKGMSALRTALIPYGCLIIEHIMDALEIKLTVCCPHSLKEGALINMQDPKQNH